MNARQHLPHLSGPLLFRFGLKLLANVTYGYTAAVNPPSLVFNSKGFSGRMPCADIADSIVQTGREALERAIRSLPPPPLPSPPDLLNCNVLAAIVFVI
jgi:hypothetical protein